MRRGGVRVAGIGGAARLDQEELDLAAAGDRAVLDALGDDVELAGAESDRAVAQLDVQLAVEDEKEIVGVGMAVPGEGARELTTIRSWPLNLPIVRGE